MYASGGGLLVASINAPHFVIIVITRGNQDRYQQTITEFATAVEWRTRISAVAERPRDASCR